MPKKKSLGSGGPAERGLPTVRGHGWGRDDWHWFDHPEMQARIAEAEEDRRVGRVTRVDTPEAFEAYLNSLA